MRTEYLGEQGRETSVLGWKRWQRKRAKKSKVYLSMHWEGGKGGRGVERLTCAARVVGDWDWLPSSCKSSSSSSSSCDAMIFNMVTRIDGSRPCFRRVCAAQVEERVYCESLNKYAFILEMVNINQVHDAVIMYGPKFIQYRLLHLLNSKLVYFVLYKVWYLPDIYSVTTLTCVYRVTT